MSLMDKILSQKSGDLGPSKVDTNRPMGYDFGGFIP
jgi:hypothetical protein